MKNSNYLLMNKLYAIAYNWN